MTLPIVTFKVIMLGMGGIGKSTLLNRYINGVFLTSTKMTIGVDIYARTFDHEGKNIRLQIWDFGGQDRFRFLCEGYILGTSGVLLCFDLNSFTSFKDLNSWMDLIRKIDREVPILLIGCKADIDKDRVDQEVIDEYIATHGIKGFLKTSSKTGLNVDETFYRISDFMVADMNKKMYGLRR